MLGLQKYKSKKKILKTERRTDAIKNGRQTNSRLNNNNRSRERRNNLFKLLKGGESL